MVVRGEKALQESPFLRTLMVTAPMLSPTLTATPCESECDPTSLDPGSDDSMPRKLADHYAVMPPHLLCQTTYNSLLQTIRHHTHESRLHVESGP